MSNLMRIPHCDGPHLAPATLGVNIPIGQRPFLRFEQPRLQSYVHCNIPTPE